MVPRLKKPRNYMCPLRCKYGQVFKPSCTPLRQLEITTMFPDEMEALFLCDSQDLDQQEAGEKMGISRSSVQRLLAGGRKKMVEALVQNRALAIAPIQRADASDVADMPTCRQPDAKRTEKPDLRRNP